MPEPDRAGRHVRVVNLWIYPGQEAAFEAFERDAVRLMVRHGGRIDWAVRLDPQKGPDAPDEVHIVSFPDRASADSYATDPETAELRMRRAAIVSRTEVHEGVEAGPYGP
jgi:hypothetical protein